MQTERQAEKQKEEKKRRKEGMKEGTKEDISISKQSPVLLDNTGYCIIWLYHIPLAEKLSLVLSTHINSKGPDDL